MLKSRILIATVAVAGITAAGVFMRPQARGSEPNGRPGTTVEVKKQDFVRSVRLSGTVEAVQATTISAPRLAGQNNNSLVIMHLIHAGTTVRPGDMLVEFEPGHTPGFAFIGIQNDLSTLLGCTVDLGTPAGLSKYIRDRVMGEAREVHVR